MHQQSKMLYHAEPQELHIVEDRVGIHTVKTIVDKKQPTILHLPGLSGEAVEGFKSLAPCLERGFNVASMSFRGRGRSSTPDKDYTLGDHVNDLALVIDHLNAEKLILVATSASTLYAARYLLEYGCHNVDGLVIVDHPLRVNKLESGWAEKFSKLTINGVPVTTTMRRSAMDEIEKESEAEDYYFDFMDLELPTLVMYPSVPKGVIGDADVELFQRQAYTKLVEFEDSDHIIRLRQPEKYLEEIIKFVGTL